MRKLHLFTISLFLLIFALCPTPAPAQPRTPNLGLITLPGEARESAVINQDLIILDTAVGRKGILSIPAQHSFASSSAVDAYLSTNFISLVGAGPHQTFILVSVGWANQLWAWQGQTHPATYNNVFWANVTALFVGPQAPTTFAGLPSCGPALAGAAMTITDGPASPAWHQSVSAGGGSTVMTLFCNGANWTVEAY